MRENNIIFKFPFPTWAIILLMFCYTIYLHYHFGMDANWDTANYHYFLGWMTATKNFYRYGAVASVHTFFNPLCDYFNYIIFNVSPYLGALYHSVIFTIVLYLVYKIAVQLLGTSSAGFTQIIALIACIIGGTSPNGVFILGAFSNEHVVCLFLLLSLLMAIILLQRPVNICFIIFAGVFAGIAVGLKLTATPYALSLWLAMACVANHKIKTMSLFTLGLILGYLLCEGPFWLLRWDEYRNPIFPLANNIFHSPYYLHHNYLPTGHLTWKKIMLSFTWPVQWLYNAPCSSIHVMRDGRILLAFLGIFAIFFTLFKRKETVKPERLLLLITFIVGWITWVFLFHVFRYLLFLNLLSGILLMLGLLTLKLISLERLKQTAVIFVIVGVFLMLSTVYGHGGGRRSWENSFVKATLPFKLHSNQLVLIAGNRLSYLIPVIIKQGANVASLYSQPWYYGDKKKLIEPNPARLPSINNVFILQNGEEYPIKKNKFFTDLRDHRHYVCSKIKTNFAWHPRLCKFKI